MPLQNALLYLVQALFNIYLFVLVIRLVLALVHAEFSHPVTQLVVRFTSFIIKPMRKVMPDIKQFETATFVLILIVEIIKFLLISLLSYGMPGIIGLIFISIADTIQLFLLTFTYAILIEAIITWIQPGSPMNSLLNQFTSPVMRPLRQLIPPMGGIDITPIPAIIILQLLSILLIKPMIAIGMGMAFG